MEEYAIEFDGVVKSLGGRKVLDGLSFRVARGESLAIMGASGTGKSVTLRHIVGLLEPDKGEVRTADMRIGYLFQSGALLAWKTVGENVALPLRETTRMPEAEIVRRTEAALSAVGLADAADLYPSEISGGMAKRAGLARAIVRDVETILYDEPTSGLDPVTSVQIANLIRNVNVSRHATSVTVTHDLNIARAVASRIMLIKDGRAAVCLPRDEFLRSEDPDVAEIVAASFGEIK